VQAFLGINWKHPSGFGVEIPTTHAYALPMTASYDFLPGVPTLHILERLEKADGHEVSSGKLASPESSAALAVNTFGWFVERPERLPPFPMVGQINWRAEFVEVEYCARFPWRGGRYPWLDALVETSDAIIGVESKRFEPFRDRKDATLSVAYNRPVWHDQMAPYELMRDKLRSHDVLFECLDAVQLVKHAFGLVTEGRRKAKRPYLVNLFAETSERAGKRIDDALKIKHRAEIAQFTAAVNGAEVGFGAISYREWLDTWSASDVELVGHRAAILNRSGPNFQAPLSPIAFAGFNKRFRRLYQKLEAAQHHRKNRCERVARGLLPDSRPFGNSDSADCVQQLNPPRVVRMSRLELLCHARNLR
jgi:restriction endonuclease-like protein